MIHITNLLDAVATVLVKNTPAHVKIGTLLNDPAAVCLLLPLSIQMCVENLQRHHGVGSDQISIAFPPARFGIDP